MKEEESQAAVEISRLSRLALACMVVVGMLATHSVNKKSRKSLAVSRADTNRVRARLLMCH